MSNEEQFSDPGSAFAAKFPSAFDTRDLIARVREIIEGPARLALDTGEAQVVDVTGVMLGEYVSMESIAVVQRAIDRVTHGTAGTGYAMTFPMNAGAGIAVVFRGVALVGGGA